MALPKRIIAKTSAESKKRVAKMIKSLNKSPRAQAKENERIRKLEFKHELERREEAKRDEFAQNIASFSGNNITYDSDDGRTHGKTDDETLERRYTTREAREKHTIKGLVDLYVASLAKGKPSLALTDPQQEAHICNCADKRTKHATLYMMRAHVERSLAYCSCNPLVEVLFQMQFLASGGKTPNVAIHFAMLNYLHITKMIEKTATHGFAQIASMINDGDKPLQKDILNNVYLLYRRIINHSTDLTFL